VWELLGRYQEGSNRYHSWETINVYILFRNKVIGYMEDLDKVESNNIATVLDNKIIKLGS